MTVGELIKRLSRFDPDLPAMVVREDDPSDWANINRVEEHHDPVGDIGDAAVALALWVK